MIWWNSWSLIWRVTLISIVWGSKIEENSDKLCTISWLSGIIWVFCKTYLGSWFQMNMYKSFTKIGLNMYARLDYNLLLHCIELDIFNQKAIWNTYVIFCLNVIFKSRLVRKIKTSFVFCLSDILCINILLLCYSYISTNCGMK